MENLGERLRIWGQRRLKSIKKALYVSRQGGVEEVCRYQSIKIRFVFDLIVFITCLNYLFDVLLSQPSGLSGFYLKAEQHVFY